MRSHSARRRTRSGPPSGLVAVASAGGTVSWGPGVRRSRGGGGGVSGGGGGGWGVGVRARVEDAWGVGGAGAGGAGDKPNHRRGGGAEEVLPAVERSVVQRRHVGGAFQHRGQRLAGVGAE